MTQWLNHNGPWREWHSATNSARMHHAWIFAGKTGVGKRDFALKAARELVAEAGVPQPAEHPDIFELTYGPKDKKAESARDSGKPFELARSLRVGQIREMQRRLTTRPTLGARRVIIVNPADDLETASSNALLKSLEEPPKGTFFVLITHRPSRLLPTIRSRCRILRFPDLDHAQLTQMLTASGQVANPDVVRAAAGSYGAAARFIEEGLAPVARLMEELLKGDDANFAARAELSRQIGPRADRVRMQAVFELAQRITSERARQSQSPGGRMALVQAHTDLVALASQAPTHNFDPGLLSLEIGTLLVSVHTASEPAHG